VVYLTNKKNTPTEKITTKTYRTAVVRQVPSAIATSIAEGTQACLDHECDSLIHKYTSQKSRARKNPNYNGASP